jgi:mono/diheme cytochrome c family protein
MKSVSNKITSVLTAIFVVFFFIGISLMVSAQDKPKGKPWPAPEAALKVKNPIKVDDASISEGKELYAQHCKSCHGAKGKGDGTKAEKIDISCGDFTGEDFAKISDAEAFWKTTEGRKPMPSFKEKLSDNERWTVINYVRSLGKAK